jgi:hypothetical protein
MDLDNREFHLLPGERERRSDHANHDDGQLIRVPVGCIRVVGRTPPGVIVFSVKDKERVVSAEHIEGEGGGTAEEWRLQSAK